MRLLLSITAAAALLTGCDKPAATSDPRQTAKADIQQRITNDITGWARTVRIDVENSSTNTADWTAEAEIERVASAGAVERTNLIYRCLAPNTWTIVSSSEERQLLARTIAIKTEMRAKPQ